MKPLAVIISPNYKEYAATYLADCLSSLRAQTFSDFDIFLIDNETSEQSFALLKQLAPEIPENQIMRRERNDGFAGGNNAALRAAMAEGYEWAMLLNMDTEAAPDCLEKLMSAANNSPRTEDGRVSFGAIQARLMLHSKKDIVNSLGNETHFLGFGFSRGYGDAYDNKVHDLEHAADNLPYPEIAYPSGAAVLFNVEALKKVGLLDEEMWMYNEDQDLGWRLWLAGYPCVLAPAAAVYHKYEFSRSIQKYYWMDRNRIIAILKNYHILTLVLIAPAFIVMELGLALFSFQSGWWKEKLAVWNYFLSAKHWRYILCERRRIQSTRVTKEIKIARLIVGRIWYQEIGDAKLKLVNPVFELYWRIVRTIIGFFNI